MMNRKVNEMAAKQSKQTNQVDQLIEVLRADREKVGYDYSNQNAYILGYISSMLQGLADTSPKVRKELESTLNFIKARA
jgi:hypothetical protein